MKNDFKPAVGPPVQASRRLGRRRLPGARRRAEQDAVVHLGRRWASRASSPGRSRRRAPARTCAWSRRASGRISSRPTRAPSSAGRSSSPAWSRCWREGVSLALGARHFSGAPRAGAGARTDGRRTAGRPHDLDVRVETLGTARHQLSRIELPVHLVVPVVEIHLQRHELAAGQGERRRHDRGGERPSAELFHWTVYGPGRTSRIMASLGLTPPMITPLILTRTAQPRGTYPVSLYLPPLNRSSRARSAVGFSRLTAARVSVASAGDGSTEVGWLQPTTKASNRAMAGWRTSVPGSSHLHSVGGQLDGRTIMNSSFNATRLFPAGPSEDCRGCADRWLVWDFVALSTKTGRVVQVLSGSTAPPLRSCTEALPS